MIVIYAEQPQRTATALAALLAAPINKRAAGAWTVAGAVHVVSGCTDVPSATGLARVLLQTGHSVEGVMEVACAHGFHAEELGRTGIVEFWIGEAMLVELVTSDASARFDLAA